MSPTDSPAVVPPNYDKIFKGYSYIAPSILFSKNAISEDILKPSNYQTDTSTLVQCQLKNESSFFQQYSIDLNEQILGDGSFSVCRRCVKKISGKEYAVKIVSRKIDCTQEINLLRACQGHPNIVELHDVHHDEAHTYLVLELLKGGELLRRIRRKSKFTEVEASTILRKLVSAVSFMHHRGVVHRDLKPENLLFTSDDDLAEIKIVDFGFARLKKEKEQLHTPCFTLHYAAPEVLNGDPEGYDESCDLWSLGVILYTMLSGRAPFHARSRDESAYAVMARIREGDFNFNSPSWVGVSDEAKRVTTGLLTVNPKKRLTMGDLKRNNWVQGGDNIPQTPLMTPDILSSSCSAEQNLNTTFNAFHKAHKDGFRLQTVLNAKLAQRRRLKKSSSETSSSSNFSSGSSTPTTPKKQILNSNEDILKISSSSSCNSSANAKKENVFCFGEARVKEYLRTLSSSPINPENMSPCPSTSGSRRSSSVYIVESNNKVDLPSRAKVEKNFSTGSSCILIDDNLESDIFLRDSPLSPPINEQVSSSSINVKTMTMIGKSESIDSEPNQRLSSTVSMKSYELDRQKNSSLNLSDKLPVRQSARIRKMISCSSKNISKDSSNEISSTRKRKRDVSKSSSKNSSSKSYKKRRKNNCDGLGIRKSQRLNVSR